MNTPTEQRRPSKWQLWPLLMALGFVCMTPTTSDSFLPKLLAVLSITFALSYRLGK